MLSILCDECHQPFSVPRERTRHYTTCPSCFHWKEASRWLERTINAQRTYHPAIVSAVEEEYIAARVDFQRSVFLRELPVQRAHIPIRLIRLECRIVAANIDAVCRKARIVQRGSELLALAEDEPARLLRAKQFSMAWRTACGWRDRLRAELAKVRTAKQFYDVSTKAV